MDHVVTLVSELRRSRNPESVAAVSVTGIDEILSELIRRECHDIPVTIPKFDMDLSVHIVFVPNPARDRCAVRVIDFAGKMRQRCSPNASRKNQQTEANKLERDEGGREPPDHTVAPRAVHLAPAGKNVKRGKQHRLIKSVRNVMELGPVPESHESKS